jgi:hypothetical protein
MGWDHRGGPASQGARPAGPRPSGARRRPSGRCADRNARAARAGVPGARPSTTSPRQLAWPWSFVHLAPPHRPGALESAPPESDDVRLPLPLPLLRRARPPASAVAGHLPPIHVAT